MDNSLRPLQSLRIMPVEGDYMQPTLRGGDFVMTVPASRYEGEWIYVIDKGFPYIARAQKMVGVDVVRLFGDNQLYPSQEVPLTWFNANVLARVVAHIDVFDDRPFDRQYQSAA